MPRSRPRRASARERRVVLRGLDARQPHARGALARACAAAAARRARCSKIENSTKRGDHDDDDEHEASARSAARVHAAAVVAAAAAAGEAAAPAAAAEARRAAARGGRGSSSSADAIATLRIVARPRRSHTLRGVKLATFIAAPGAEPRAGEVRGEQVVALGDGDSVLARLRSGDREPAAGAAHALADVTLLAPHAPRAIFGIGLNYRAHAAEQGLEPPEQPIVFMKLPTSAARARRPGAAARRSCARLDYEGELAVVMGPDGEVAGYAVADDVSARDLQRREPQWTRAKGADGFCPFGPWVTTADEVADPEALALRTWVNGELRQDSSTVGPRLRRSRRSSTSSARRSRSSPAT